jgi:hypothetical protein
MNPEPATTQSALQLLGVGAAFAAASQTSGVLTCSGRIPRPAKCVPTTDGFPRLADGIEVVESGQQSPRRLPCFNYGPRSKLWGHRVETLKLEFRIPIAFQFL